MKAKALSFPEISGANFSWAEHHSAAADHHEQAARHHREAARHRDARNYLLAAQEVQSANNHAVTALYHSNEAAKNVDS